ncbi:MAG: CRISPR-associated endonuclease Cas2 [Candidatus Sumerlaeaceae bacterium]|nr:CRISPR-associated endonuclease Cas2 [Candidatus Sumerlaeaceae bacterium]
MNDWGRRRLYLVAYDVGDDKRWRRVFKIMRNWGDRVQLSVWRCELTPDERDTLEAQLRAEINPREDRVLLALMGTPIAVEAAGRLRTLGLPIPPVEDGALVV